MNGENELVARIESLERANRKLRLGVGIAMLTPLLLLAGWQQIPPPAPPVATQEPDVIKASRLEIVDPKGVPMVVLSTGRSHEGGSIVLRDSLGERRGWWQSNADGSSLALSKEGPEGQEGSSTAGFSVGSGSAEMNVLGLDGAMLSASVRGKEPRLDLWGVNGASLFGAPFRKP